MDSMPNSNKDDDSHITVKRRPILRSVALGAISTGYSPVLRNSITVAQAQTPDNTLFESDFEDDTIGEPPTKWEEDPRFANGWDILEVREGGADGSQKKLRAKRKSQSCDYSKEFECSSGLRTPVIDAEVSTINWHWKKMHKWFPSSRYPEDPWGPVIRPITSDGSSFFGIQLGASTSEKKYPLGIRIAAGDGNHYFPDLYEEKEFTEYSVSLDATADEFTVSLDNEPIGTFPLQIPFQPLHRVVAIIGGFNPDGDCEIDELQIYPACEITAEITDFKIESDLFQPGDLVEGQVTVKNTSDCQHEFFVGFGVIDRNGTIYDNDGGTGRPLTVPAGETETVTIGWQVEADAEPGPYDVGTAIWEESNRNALETRLVETIEDKVFRVGRDGGARAREFDWSDFRKYKQGGPLMEKRDSIHNGWFFDSGSFAGRNLVGAAFGGQRSFSSSGFGVERFTASRRGTQRIELRYDVSGISTVKSQSFVPVPIIGHNLLYFQLAIQDLSGNLVAKKRQVVYNKTVPELDDALTSIMTEGFKELLSQGHPMVGAGLTIIDTLNLADGGDIPLREEYNEEGTITISTSDLEGGKEYRAIAEVFSITGVNLVSAGRIGWGVNDFLFNGEIDLFIR